MSSIPSRVVFADDLADLLLERMRLVVLDDCGVGDTPVGVSVHVEVASPHGEFHLAPQDDPNSPLVLLAAGIGQTPLRGEVKLAMRRSDLDDGSLVELVQGIAHSGGGLVLGIGMGVTDLRYSLSDVPRRGQLRISVRRDVNNTHPGR
jgi:hypothetical protein